AAQKAVERVSFDLIYALPDQTLADWRKQLNLALAFGTDHISAYQLTIEPNTGFYSQVARGVFTPLDDDVAADLFDYTSERLGAAGLTAYETSNHARAQAQCQHNLVYWRGLPYAAVGPGAHGRWRDGKHRWTATANIKKPERWLQQVMADAHGIEVDVALSARDRAEEIVLTSLRLSEGLDIEAASALAGFRVSELMDRDALGQLQRGGWLVVSNGIVRLTPKAQPVANHIVNQLFT
ncbi:MAG: coproporphyrinogen III oxidase, partial [Pseudomonadota bacterium]